MKTRNKKAANAPKGSKPAGTSTQTSKAEQLEPRVERPPNVFILPKSVSTEARIVTLPNPATSIPERYLVCPQKGFYEFTRIAAAKEDLKSWLIAPVHREAARKEEEQDGVAIEQRSNGYVLERPDMLVATPMDPMFLILPVLVPELKDLAGATDAQNVVEEKLHFLSVGDHLDNLCQRICALRQLLQDHPALESRFDEALKAVCKVVDAGDEKMYRLDTLLLFKELVRKARNMVTKGFPTSMEERFVGEALAVPELSIKRQEGGVSMAEDDNSADKERTSVDESQDSGYGSQLPSNEPAGDDDLKPKQIDLIPDETIKDLLRMQTAIHFLNGSYVPGLLRAEMLRILESHESHPIARSGKALMPKLDLQDTGVIDFAPLKRHLSKLNVRKTQAQALRSLSDNISRKRAMDEDEEAMEKTDAKKRKKEEEEAKKKNVTRGVKQLEKVDRSGMKKLSNFFTKAPAKK